MRTIVQLVIIFLLMAVATPAYSSTVSQFFKCEQDDDATEAALFATVSKWLKAAKTVEGGKDLTASLHFPIAAAMGETDFSLVITAPSAAAWGTFVDNYPGSVAQALDVEWDELAACPDSALIRSVKVE